MIGRAFPPFRLSDLRKVDLAELDSLGRWDLDEPDEFLLEPGVVGVVVDAVFAGAWMGLRAAAAGLGVVTTVLVALDKLRARR